MKVLLVHPGPEFSVQDVYTGSNARTAKAVRAWLTAKRFTP